MADQAEAFAWGILSASSFSIGSTIGLVWPSMPLKLRAVALGFGGGALLFALTLSIFGDMLYNVDRHGHGPMMVMLAASLVGGVFFLALNRIIEARGGWVRRVTAKTKQFQEWRKKRLRPLIDKMVQESEGNARMTVIESLKFEIEQEFAAEIEYMQARERRTLASFKSGRLRSSYKPSSIPSEAEFTKLASPLVEEESETAAAIRELNETTPPLAPVNGVGLSIWLGLLIDGIPEALVIGIHTVSSEGVSYALLAAFFLANVPEAMSSSIIMLENGMSKLKISLMWLFLVVMTGIGALIGSFMKEPEDAAPDDAFFFGTGAIEGFAAGAMLVMISNAMLPEAFHAGGSVSGLSVLCGFLASLFLEVSDNW